MTFFEIMCLFLLSWILLYVSNDKLGRWMAVGFMVAVCIHNSITMLET